MIKIVYSLRHKIPCTGNQSLVPKKTCVANKKRTTLISLKSSHFSRSLSYFLYHARSKFFKLVRNSGFMYYSVFDRRALIKGYGFMHVKDHIFWKNKISLLTNTEDT